MPGLEQRVETLEHIVKTLDARLQEVEEKLGEAASTVATLTHQSAEAQRQKRRAAKGRGNA